MALVLTDTSALYALADRGDAIIATHTDKTCTRVDATSFAVLERLGAREAVVFDRRFRQYGFALA